MRMRNTSTDEKCYIVEHRRHTGGTWGRWSGASNNTTIAQARNSLIDVFFAMRDRDDREDMKSAWNNLASEATMAEIGQVLGVEGDDNEWRIVASD